MTQNGNQFYKWLIDVSNHELEMRHRYCIESAYKLFQTKWKLDTFRYYSNLPSEVPNHIGKNRTSRCIDFINFIKKLNWNHNFKYFAEEQYELFVSQNCSTMHQLLNI